MRPQKCTLNLNAKLNKESCPPERECNVHWSRTSTVRGETEEFSTHTHTPANSWQTRDSCGALISPEQFYKGQWGIKEGLVDFYAGDVLLIYSVTYHFLDRVFLAFERQARTLHTTKKTWWGMSSKVCGFLKKKNLLSLLSKMFPVTFIYMFWLTFNLLISNLSLIKNFFYMSPWALPRTDCTWMDSNMENLKVEAILQILLKWNHLSPIATVVS